MKSKLVVIVVMPDSLSLDITGPADVFNGANHAIGGFNQGNSYRLMYVSPTGEIDVRLNNGLIIRCEKSLDEVDEEIDTIIIGGFPTHNKWDAFPELVFWIQSHSQNIRRICSICVGAFVLAEGGFLDHRKATTHWQYCKELGDRYKKIDVDMNSIFIKDSNIYTSAGATAGIDLSLALVEEDFTREIALQIARGLVLYLKRPGNQSQFSNMLSQQLSSKKPIKELQQWICDHLNSNLTVDILAVKVAMSPRNFARVFLEDTGYTPGKYVETVRLEFSKRYLEESDLSIEQIADKCGYGSAETMRKTFFRHLNYSPSTYRNLFGSLEN